MSDQIALGIIKAVLYLTIGGAAVAATWYGCVILSTFDWKRFAKDMTVPMIGVGLFVLIMGVAWIIISR